MKSELKKEAIELRRVGYSYSSIQKRIGVSKSTLSLWLSEMPYRPNQEAKEKLVNARLASALAKNQIKSKNFIDARDLALKDVGTLTERDIFMIGLGIYIGEGSKTNNIKRIVNSDPYIIRFAIKWLRNFGLSSENFRLRIFLYPDSDIEKSEKFWLNLTGLKKENILKAQIDQRKDKRKDRQGKLPHGTAHLSVVSAGKKEFGVLLFRRIIALINIVLEIPKDR